MEASCLLSIVRYLEFHRFSEPSADLIGLETYRILVRRVFEGLGDSLDFCSLFDGCRFPNCERLGTGIKGRKLPQEEIKGGGPYRCVSR